MDPIAKIVKIDNADVTSALPDDDDKTLTYHVEIEIDGVKYRRAFSWRVHEKYTHHFVGPLTPEQIENRIHQEVDALMSLHAAAKQHAGLIGVDLVKQLKDATA